MIDESMDKEAMKQPAQPWEFRSKPAWQRLIVMVAGVTMNVILGIVIYTYILSHYEQKYLSTASVDNGIYAYELGAQLGLKTGDKIVAINGESFERAEDVLSSRVIFGSTLTVQREGKSFDIIIPNDFYKDVTKKGRGHFIGFDNFPFTIDSVLPGTPAEKSGLKPGDKIFRVNDNRIALWGQMREAVYTNKGKPIEIGILRNGDTLTMNPTVDSLGLIGISAKNPYQLTDFNFNSALHFGTSDAMEAVIGNIKGLKQIFIGKEKASDALQGPIGIATIYGGAWDWYRFWKITGLLSMILAFMNILPIPALDGGHVVFLLIEAVTKKQFSDKVMERAQIVGMVILIALMAFAVGNDIWKHILN
jgi:regulator of sigma E protease